MRPEKRNPAAGGADRASEVFVFAAERPEDIPPALRLQSARLVRLGVRATIARALAPLVFGEVRA